MFPVHTNKTRFIVIPFSLSDESSAVRRRRLIAKAGGDLQSAVAALCH
jgi:hypothetical protein